MNIKISLIIKTNTVLNLLNHILSDTKTILIKCVNIQIQQLSKNIKFKIYEVMKIIKVSKAIQGVKYRQTNKH